MPDSRTNPTAVCIAAVAAWWSAAAWIARQSSPWALPLTNPMFTAALLCTALAAAIIAIHHARRRRATAFRIAAATLGGIAAVALVDLTGVGGRANYTHVGAVFFGDRDGPIVEFVLDPELWFRRPAHVRASGWPRSDLAGEYNLPARSRYQQTFSTDSAGFRNALDPSHPGIVLIGDSYVEGSYVSDDETSAVRLQALLDRPVANFGVAAYGSLQELKVLEKYAVPLGPKTVAWFFFEGNDLDNDQEFEDAMAAAPGAITAPRWSPSEPDRVERSLTVTTFRQLRRWSDWLVPNGIDRLGFFRADDGVTHRFYFYDFYATRTFGEFERRRFETTKAAFRRGAAICRQHGIRLVVVYVPIKFRIYGDLCTYPTGSPCLHWKPWDLETQFAAFCRAEGIELLSLTAPMHRAAEAGQLLYAPEDTHWSAAGQRFVAEQLAALTR